MTDEEIHNIYLHMSGKAEGLVEATGNADFPVLFARAILEYEGMTKEYERGFIDGMQKQMQSSVDKAVNAMSKREWVGLTDEEMQRMAKRIEELETEQDCVGWFGYDTGLRLWFEADKNDDGAIPLYKNALETKDATVQVSPLEFVEMVMEKEHLIGQPIFWAQWPNEEKK